MKKNPYKHEMKKNPYTVAKRDGLWWVVDADGYEVSYIGHPFKYEAIAAAKQAAVDDAMDIQYG